MPVGRLAAPTLAGDPAAALPHATLVGTAAPEAAADARRYTSHDGHAGTGLAPCVALLMLASLAPPQRRPEGRAA